MKIKAITFDLEILFASLDVIMDAHKTADFLKKNIRKCREFYFPLRKKKMEELVSHT